MSLIRPGTRAAVSMFLTARSLGQAAGGASLYGPVLMHWPAEAVDICTLLTIGERQVEQAFQEFQEQTNRRAI